MKTKVITGKVSHSFSYSKDEQGNVVCHLEGLESIKIPKSFLRDQEVSEGRGSIAVNYNIRVEISKDSVKAVRTPTAQDIVNSVGYPVKEIYTLSTDGAKVVVDKTSLGSDSFYDANGGKKEYRNILLDIIDENLTHGDLGETIRKRNSKEDWTEDEAKAALEAYFRAHGGDNEDAKRAAEEVISNYGLKRTVSAVIFKMVCFRELDPQAQGTGLGNFGQVFKDVWEKHSTEFRSKYRR